MAAKQRCPASGTVKQPPFLARQQHQCSCSLLRRSLQQQLMILWWMLSQRLMRHGNPSSANSSSMHSGHGGVHNNNNNRLQHHRLQLHSHLQRPLHPRLLQPPLLLRLHLTPMMKIRHATVACMVVLMIGRTKTGTLTGLTCCRTWQLPYALPWAAASNSSRIEPHKQQWQQQEMKMQWK